MEDRTLAVMRHGSVPGARGRVRPITLLGDRVLRTPCAEVTGFGPELARLVEDMFATMYGEAQRPAADPWLTRGPRAAHP